MDDKMINENLVRNDIRYLVSKTLQRLVCPLWPRSEEHTPELQSPCNLVCRLLLEKKKYKYINEPCIYKSNVDTSSYSQQSRMYTALHLITAGEYYPRYRLLYCIIRSPTARSHGLR